MIQFECSACGNQFRVQDNVAGRHGWCKICHGFILVPTIDATGAVTHPTLQERQHRLEHLLREAGVRYERLIVKIALIARKYRDAKEKAVAAETTRAELADARAQLAERERALERQSADLRSAMEALATRSASNLPPPPDPVHDLAAGTPDAETNPDHGPSATADTAAAELAQVRAEKDDAIRSLHDIQSRLLATQDICNSLRSGVEDKSRELGAAEANAVAAAQDAERLRTELQELRQVHADLDERHVELERRASGAESLERERATLAQRLAATEAQLETLREELTNAALHSESATARAAQSALELDRLRADAQAASSARDVAETALREAQTRAERAETQLAAATAETQALRERAGQAEGLENELRSATVRMAELETLLARLAPDLAAASQALGAYESRAEQAARDLEQFRVELDTERQAKLDAETPPLTAPTPTNGNGDDENLDLDDDELTLIPEIVDDDMEQNEMVNRLLRFLEPDQR